MQKFKFWMNESVNHLTESINDAKGKTSEIATADALAARGIKMVHYRDPEKGSEIEMAKQKSKLGNKLHKEVLKNSAKIADAIHAHIKSTHGIDIDDAGPRSSVAWTSQAGDIGRHTGHDEGQENPSDIVVSHDHGRTVSHFGWSLKYGKQPGLRSPGHKDMQDTLGMNKENRAKINGQSDWKESGRKGLVRRIGERVQQETSRVLKSKAKKDQKYEARQRLKDHESGEAHDPEFHEAYTKAVNASSAMRSNLIKHYHHGFNDATQEQRKTFVGKMMGISDTNFPVYKAHYDEKKDKVHVSHPAGDFDAAHDPKKGKSHVVDYFSRHASEDGGQGTTMHIYARTNTNDHHKVMSIQVKHNSGVYSPVGFSVGALGAGFKKIVAGKA
jgi:hypothetical protein